MKNLAILGAGGHGKVAAAIAEELGWTVHFFDIAYPEIKKCGLWDIKGDENYLIKNSSKYKTIFIAIGNNEIREKKQCQFKSLGFKITSLISPDATVSKFSQIGDGVLVVANSCINVDSIIGDGVIINTGATIDHDNIIGDFTHISPGVNLAGGVSVGKRSWIGIGSTVIHKINISDNVIVGAGAVLINDVPESLTVAGCPARVIR